MSRYFDEQRKKLRAIQITAICLGSAAFALNVTNLVVTINNWNNEDRLQEILEADSNIKIHDEVISSIKMDAKIRSDGGCGSINQLTFYYNYDLNDNFEIPAYEIVYEVDGETFDNFKENFNKATPKKQRKMIEELARNYDPTKVVDHVKDNENGLSY